MEFAKFECKGKVLGQGLEHLFRAARPSDESRRALKESRAHLTGDLEKSTQSLLSKTNPRTFEDLLKKDLCVGVVRAALDSAPDDVFEISVSELPCPDDSLDVILYWDQNEFVTGLDGDELLRALKPDGALLVIEIQSANSEIHREFLESFERSSAEVVPLGSLRALMHTLLDGPLDDGNLTVEGYCPEEGYQGKVCRVLTMLPKRPGCLPKTERVKRNIVAEPFHDWREVYPELGVFLESDNFDDVLSEALALSSQWKEWPESHYGEGGDMDWKVVPFLHCFPASDAAKVTWIDRTCRLCPKTCRLLKGLPGARTALFSRMGPRTRISSHRGWSELANDVLRCHVCLRVPPPADDLHSCGLWVEGEKKLHRQGEIVVFDDSKLHKAFNESDQERIILIVDLIRPERIPKGTAKLGMTPELEALIASYT